MLSEQRFKHKKEHDTHKNRICRIIGTNFETRTEYGEEEEMLEQGQNIEKNKCELKNRFVGHKVISSVSILTT